MLRKSLPGAFVNIPAASLAIFSRRGMSFVLCWNPEGQGIIAMHIVAVNNALLIFPLVFFVAQFRPGNKRVSNGGTLPVKGFPTRPKADLAEGISACGTAWKSLETMARRQSSDILPALKDGGSKNLVPGWFALHRQQFRLWRNSYPSLA
jgi:hypothetical protein